MSRHCSYSSIRKLIRNELRKIDNRLNVNRKQLWRINNLKYNWIRAMFALEENPWQVLFVSHQLLEWFDKHGKKLWLFVPNYQNIKYGEITGLITSNVKRLKFWNRSYKLVLIDKLKTNQILEYFFDLSFKAGELYITQKNRVPLSSTTPQFNT